PATGSDGSAYQRKMGQYQCPTSCRIGHPATAGDCYPQSLRCDGFERGKPRCVPMVLRAKWLGECMHYHVGDATDMLERYRARRTAANVAWKMLVRIDE